MYDKELEFAVQLCTAIAYIAQQCEEHDYDYPLLCQAIDVIFNGLVMVSEGACPHCGGELSIKSQAPIGGLQTAVEALEEAIDWLTKEVDLSEIQSSDEG